MTTHEIGQRAPSRHARRKRRRNYGPVIILALVCAAIFAAGYCVGVSAADKAVPTLPEPVLESTATPEPSAEPSVAPTPSPTTEAVLWRDDIVTDGNLLDYDLQVTMQACCEEYGVPYDAKDERMSGNPNQMNIQSMYSDIDLDANGIEMEFQASMEELLWFVNKHLANTGRGSFDGTEVKVIFDRDVLINETEAINNCKNSVGILSDETIVKMHPWVSDPEQELQRIKDEKEEAMADPYQAAFMKNRQNGGDGSGNPVTDQNGGGGNAEE